MKATPHNLRLHYVAPVLRRNEVTPVRVRDELVRCFVSAMSCMPQLLPPGASPLQLRTQVESFVREAFKSAGASFEAPTKEAILAAMARCRTNALGMKMDESIIYSHWEEMTKLVDQLPDAARDAR